jgi:hypothetical protein
MYCALVVAVGGASMVSMDDGVLADCATVRCGCDDAVRMTAPAVTSMKAVTPAAMISAVFCFTSQSPLKIVPGDETKSDFFRNCEDAVWKVFAFVPGLTGLHARHPHNIHISSSQFPNKCRLT